jgi:hypothetical protein
MKKYKWNSRKARKLLSYFYEAENKMENYEHFDKLVEVSYIMDALIDRFKIDVSKVKPSNTGRVPSSLLYSILRSASVREHPCNSV